MEDSKVRVLLEDIDHKFKTIAEGINGLLPLNDKFDELEKKVDQLQEDMMIIKASLPLKANVTDLEKVKKDLGIVQKKLKLKTV